MPCPARVPGQSAQELFHMDRKGEEGPTPLSSSTGGPCEGWEQEVKSSLQQDGGAVQGQCVDREGRKAGWGAGLQ